MTEIIIIFIVFLCILGFLFPKKDLKNKSQEGKISNEELLVLLHKKQEERKKLDMLALDIGSKINTGHTRKQLALRMAEKALEKMKSGNYIDAINDFNKLLTIDKSPSIYEQLAQCYYKTEPNRAKSIHTLDSAIELYPENIRLYLKRMEICAEIGNHQAREDFKIICELSPSTGEQLKKEGFLEYLRQREIESYDNDPY